MDGIANHFPAQNALYCRIVNIKSQNVSGDDTAELPQKRPGVWTQTQASAWLASVKPTVPISQNDRCSTAMAIIAQNISIKVVQRAHQRARCLVADSEGHHHASDSIPKFHFEVHHVTHKLGHRTPADMKLRDVARHASSADDDDDDDDDVANQVSSSLDDSRAPADESSPLANQRTLDDTDNINYDKLLQV